MIDTREELLAFLSRSEYTHVMKFAGKFRLFMERKSLLGESVADGIVESMVQDEFLKSSYGFVNRFELTEKGRTEFFRIFPTETGNLFR